MPLRLRQAVCIHAAITERTKARRHSSFQLGSDGNQTYSLSGSHRPRLSESYPVFPSSSQLLFILFDDYSTAFSACQVVFQKNITKTRVRYVICVLPPGCGREDFSKTLRDAYFLSPRSSALSSRILYLRILPAAFMGNLSVNTKYLGTL